jgi:Fur family transcriptional regulator, ferric uptake regulator
VIGSYQKFWLSQSNLYIPIGKTTCNCKDLRYNLPRMEELMRASSVDQIILETLANQHTHLTSHQVFEQIRPRLPALNPSTVYRALERLAHHGAISVSDMGTGSAVFESLTSGMHHHLVCQQCGRVCTIPDEQVSSFFRLVQESSRFEVCTNHLVLFGLCGDCQNHSASHSGG